MSIPTSIPGNIATCERRRFLKTGVAVSALTAGGIAFADESGTVSSGPLLRPERFVVDVAFAEAVAAGRTARKAGLNVVDVHGDMSDLWYSDLDLAWRRAPMTFAGVTAPEGLFVLETLAMDRGMRVVYRGDHVVGKGAEYFHRLRGPEPLVSSVLGCLAANDAVSVAGASLARSLVTCPAGRQAVESVVIGDAPVRRGEDFDRRGELVSWIIAPKDLATPVGY